MPKRKRKPSRGRRENARRATREGTAAPELAVHPRDDLFSGDAWESLRQGARNVAGVRYQLLVTAYLLAESRRGTLPFVELVPEGFEDIDCLDRDSRRWLVQVKEVGAGAGSFTASSVAEVIFRAARVAECPHRIVVVTDGQLGSQLVESGWESSISEISGPGLDKILGALQKRGHKSHEAQDLAKRTHLIRVPWNAVPLLTRSISESFDLMPAVAAVVSSRLIDDLSEVAADQRSASANFPGRRMIGDLDVLVDNVHKVVDVDGLNSAIRAGICEVADYASRPGAGLSVFLQGVDALPAHIGADFDVIRPTPCRAVQIGLEQARYVLITGPSGAGKSAQMWRSARDVARGAQVVRVHRLEKDNEVEELIRYVRILEPSEARVVAVCCDDLGRPRTSAWPLAVRRLLELSGVVLIGAVRREDFTADLLRYGGQLVELRLDDDTAETIAMQLEYAGVHLALEVAEAVSKSDGQLMEYVSLLTTGRRLQAVLASQAESLLNAEDQIGADIARLICSAHILGVVIDASDLERGVGRERSDLTRALRRLQDEHIITTDDQQAWRGLHERRSNVLTQLLHGSPPPTLRDTLGNVLSILRTASLSWALRRIIELFGDIAVDQSGAIRGAVRNCRHAKDVAILFEGLERSDHSVTAWKYIPVIERHRHPRMSVSGLTMLVCTDKLSDVQFGKSRSDSLDRVWRPIRACTDDLPPRSTVYCDAAASDLQAEQLINHTVGSSLEDAVRLLEATGPYVSLPPEELGLIASTFPWPEGVLDRETRLLHGRLLCSSYLAAIEPAAFVDAFGDVATRLCNAVRADGDTVSLLVDRDESIATIELLADPTEHDDFAGFEWDLPASSDGTRDFANDRAVELATYIGECCPELRTVEIKTVLADRSRFVVGELEPGYKRLDPSARPRRSNVRIVAGVIAAIARRLAAFSWTELIRARTRIGEDVAGLVSEATRRLSPYDNAGRRREWSATLDQIERDLLMIGLPPPLSYLDSAGAPVRWDLARDEDKLAVALNTMVTALRRLVPDPPVDREFVQIAAQIQDAIEKLNAGLNDPRTPTTSQEDGFYPRLVEELSRLRSLLITVWLDNSTMRSIKGTPTELDNAVDAIVETVSSRRLQAERKELETAFSDAGSTVHIVLDRKPFPTSIVGHQWVVEVSLENWEAALQESNVIDREVVEVAVTLLCVAEDVVLPIAVSLSRPERGGYIPLAPDSIRQMAAIRGRRFELGTTSKALSSVADELVLASWKNARDQMRPETWPAVRDVSAAAHLEHAIRITQHTTWRTEEITAIIQELVARVEDELQRTSRKPIAAELAIPSVLSARKLDDDSAEFLVAVASLFAIIVDLEYRTNSTSTT